MANIPQSSDMFKQHLKLKRSGISFTAKYIYSVFKKIMFFSERTKQNIVGNVSDITI